MSLLRVSNLATRPIVTVVSRYGVAVFSVALALGTALTLRRYDLPHPFTAFSMAAIAVTFWYAGTGPGIVALVLSSLGMQRFLFLTKSFPAVPLGNPTWSFMDYSHS